MTTEQVAKRLVELMRQGKVLEAQSELYSKDIVCIEPDSAPVKTTRGFQAVAEKGKAFAAMIEERHGGSVSDPLVAGRYFSIEMTLDATLKGMGRQLLDEICVYEVKDGKIVFEQFFY